MLHERAEDALPFAVMAEVEEDRHEVNEEMTMLESLDLWMWSIIAIDLVVAVFAIMAIRFAAGLLFGVDSTNELAKK